MKQRFGPKKTVPHSLSTFSHVLVHDKYQRFGKEDLQMSQQPCVFQVLCNAKVLVGSYYHMMVRSGEHLLPVPQSSPVSCVILSN